MRSPANNSKCDNIENNYVVFADNLKNYVDLAPLTFQSLNLDALDEGDGVSLTLLRHRAKWHPSCKAMIKKSKTKRLHQATKKRHASAPTHCAPDPKYTRSKCESFSTKHCFFNCTNETNAENPLRQVMTKQLDSRLREYAKVLENEQLITRLSAADLIAQQAKYHDRCALNLFNEAKARLRKDHGHGHSLWHSLTFAGLLDYIEDGWGDPECPPFKLSHLTLLLKHRLTKLGVSDTYVHSTKLNEKILRKIPDMSCLKQGKFVWFAFNVQISALIFGKLDNNEQQDDEAIALLKAASILRHDMFDHGQSFNGKFAAECQTRCVPNSLMSFVHMLTRGNNIQNRESEDGGCDTTQQVVSISQLIMFNSYK